MDNKKLNLFSAFRFLSRYTGKFTQNLLVFNLGWILGMLLKIYIPITFAIMIDEIVYYQHLDTFFNVSLVFMVMLIFSSLLYYFNDTQFSYMSILFDFHLKRDIFGKILRADAKTMADANTGDRIQHIQEYAGRSNILIGLTHLMNNTLLMLLYIVYVFLLGWQIGLLMMIIVPISVGISLKYGAQIRSCADRQRAAYGVYSGWLMDILSGIRDIRLLGAQHKVKSDFIDHQDGLIRLQVKNAVSKLTAEHIMKAVKIIIQLSIFGVVAYMAVRGQMTVGIMTLILTYYANMSGQAQMLSAMYLDMQNNLSYVQRIYDLLHAPTDETWPGQNTMEIREGEIVFEDVSYGYDPTRMILRDLSLTVRRGERIALVGESGVGKSTLAYMLIGFYAPQQGRISIDSQDIMDCTVHSLRDQVGLIQQETLIFDGSVRDNLRLGKRRATDNEIMEACRKAEIHDVILSLPEGYDTMLGRDGIALSGGQTQRIAIARIYLKDPQLIIFDEATSALDDETERNIHQSWKQVLRDRTAIMIAHRLSSVQLCDRVVLLQDGKIAEQGSPDDLMMNGSMFQRLFSIKAGADDQ